MRPTSVVLVAGLCVVLAACSGSSATTAPSQAAASAALSTAPSEAPTSAATPSSVPTPAPSAPASTGPSSSANAEATAVPTSLDPCTIIPNATVNAMAGTTFPAGTESVTSGQGRICTYGARTTDVFMVIVGQAPDPATAKAWEANAQAGLAKAAGKGFTFTEDATIGDGAVYSKQGVTISGASFSGSALYFLKGNDFVGFSQVELGPNSMTTSVMIAEAKAIVSKLP